MSGRILRFAGIVGLTLLLVGPALAQSLPGPPLPLKGTLGDIPTAPVPKDQFGNPIQPTPPTAEERDAERQAKEDRAQKQRVEDERQAAEASHAADESRATEKLAEEKGFHDRIMTAVYIGLAILAVGICSQLFKKK